MPELLSIQMAMRSTASWKALSAPAKIQGSVVYEAETENNFSMGISLKALLDEKLWCGFPACRDPGKTIMSWINQQTFMLNPQYISTSVHWHTIDQINIKLVNWVPLNWQLHAAHETMCGTILSGPNSQGTKGLLGTLSHCCWTCSPASWKRLLHRLRTLHFVWQSNSITIHYVINKTVI